MHDRVKIVYWEQDDQHSQLTFTCLKSPIRTLQNGVKYVQS